MLLPTEKKPGLPLILCQLVVSIMCSSLIKLDKNSFSFDAVLTLRSVHFRDADCCWAVGCQRRTLLPQQQVDEHSDGEEGAPDGRVAAQEEEEVAEKAEKDHPDHVKLKEQVESIETSCHCAQVLHKRGEACGMARKKGIKDGWLWWCKLYEGAEWIRNRWTLTQHPEKPTQQADNQQLPYLLQALLSCRQQAAVSKLLEELLPAERSHH